MEILGGYRLINFRLYAITNQLSCHPTLLLEQIQYLLDLGVPAIQLREKTLSDDDFQRLAYSVWRLAVDYPTQIFINSRWQLAAQMQVSGVHLPAQMTNQIQMAKSAGFAIGHVNELTLSVFEKNIPVMIKKCFSFVSDVLI